MRYKNAFSGFLAAVLLQLVSCTSEKQIDIVEVENETRVDTLYYHEKIFLDENGFALPRKIFKYKAKTNGNLPKNEVIIMTLAYDGEYKELVKHTDIDLLSKTDQLKIEKIDNYHFKLVIDKDYSGKMVSMWYYLTPKKNYVMKVYFQEAVVEYPNKTIGSAFNFPVEQN
ncbi:hypothetical protein [Fluviicola sp.]|uniref:hypothetical protein n=1 Tax=Fluviicola sp. TaxID=1917219 RepID=UPI002605DD0C|nr:hypothetical protein [Fluviicola sp.]